VPSSAAPDVRPPTLPELDPAAVARRSLPAEPAGLAELERVRREAHAAGFEDGRRSESVRVAHAIESVRALIAQLERADERRQQEASERIAILSTAIASHLVEREVKTSPDIIADVVRRAVAEFPVTDPITVHLNPSDLALLSSSGLSGPSVHQHLTGGQAVRWIADPTVRSGGCLVEGTDRIVDGRLSHTLERICQVLTDG
jgi:flagellar assembly protein FliH